MLKCGKCVVAMMRLATSFSCPKFPLAAYSVTYHTHTFDGFAPLLPPTQALLPFLVDKQATSARLGHIWCDPLSEARVIPSRGA